ncbi:Dihydroneopterin aldolase [Piscirickettsia salmonis]|uniref:7,8-dihydroneopterin aldolase n=1 Tax=Piscirickettsia salmonis TaxID=1238 RepID=A0A1L6TEZ6_PISSA|nr:dihydroneopterin aldolase [Piscirickettsia salmonis]ALB24072.1 dihydroneopterin aldolase [Piscirickettsia salmonis]ALT18707.1 dihydroneopterin aldolase [Piscirickettsia salmonis LF-89 = ATCC VR-1361]ALY03883.1 dihydroneopterin aldolase [Piscirickettsia salmonis]AMA43446.1 dihydroneopterin aldolase [Piscirickettsia salmonis]AOS35915.1 dihydroneopterin aldolase [Piscirickettsia salmonis]
MLGQIFIKNLVQQASMGVHNWEKEIKQRLEFDITVEFNLARAIETDDCANTVDYTVITQLVHHLINQQHFNLLETLAYHLSSEIYKKYPTIKTIEVTIRKPSAVAMTDTVGVTFKHEY